jgi:hypothetical protein
VTCLCHRRGEVRLLMLFFLLLHSASVFAQANGGQATPLLVPLPVSIEWGESIYPWAESKLIADRFTFLAGTQTLKFQFSNQTPGFLGGSQFQGLPGGYRITEFSLARKWGKIHAFRSLGFNPRTVPPAQARCFTGAALEMPRSILGANLSAYLLRAAPDARAPLPGISRMATPVGSQVGLALSRELGQKTRILAEWVQTNYSASSALPGDRSLLSGGTRRGLMVKFDSTLSKTDLNFTLITRDEGLANPAMPMYRPANQTLRLDVRRKFKQHQFQYGYLFDSQRAVPILQWAVRGVRDQTVRWFYAPKRLPQIAASHTWSRQHAANRNEEEETSRLSLAKTLRRINASVAILWISRVDLRSSCPVLARHAATADATFEIRKDTRLHVRYEIGRLSQLMLLQRLSTSGLQLDTRIHLWEGKLSVMPAFDFRRQGGDSPALRLSAARFAVAAQIKLPRRFPGTNLLINLGSQHFKSAGRPGQGGRELSLHWNFKRM